MEESEGRWAQPVFGLWLFTQQRLLNTYLLCCWWAVPGAGRQNLTPSLPPEAHRAHPKLYLMEFNSGNGPFTHHPFSSHLGQSSVFGPSFSFRSPESHKPRTVSVYRSSTYRTVFVLSFFPTPLTATMCSHCCPHINILYLQRQPSSTIHQEISSCCRMFNWGFLFPGGEGYRVPGVLAVESPAALKGTGCGWSVESDRNTLRRACYVCVLFLLLFQVLVNIGNYFDLAPVYL